MSVHWTFEDVEYTGMVEFQNEGENKVRITADDDRRHHTFWNEVVTADVAKDIKDEIVAINYDISNFEI